MKKVNFWQLMMVTALVITFASCSKTQNAAQPGQQSSSLDVTENGANPDETVVTTLGSRVVAGSSERKMFDHFLYTESNEGSGNRIMAYGIADDGSLHFATATASGGAGSGGGLGSEGAIALNSNHTWLFAVNAGSNSVSSFKVRADGSLTLAYTESSKGTTPVSVSVYGNLLYVLNMGSDNIHGFKIGSNGSLTHIDGSTQNLSGKGVVAPQISFTPDGNWLMVTEKATNNISSFKVKNDGSAAKGAVTASTGATPFGFDFARNNNNYMIVSNAAGGADAAGSSTSYKINNNGVPKQVNGAIASQQGAPCWVATTKFGRYAFVANTGSNSISSYYITPQGGLLLIKGAAASTGSHPADIVVASDNYNVYVINGLSASIGQYHRSLLGGLQANGTLSGIPAFAAGLATY